MTIKSVVMMLGLALFMAVGSTATAQETPDQQFEHILTALDVFPTRAQLDKAFPDAQERALKAMQDNQRTQYERQRALSVLSLYPNARTRTAFESLLASQESGELRKYAVYGLARTFGQTADEKLVATVASALEDKNSDVRKFARLSVKYLKHPDAAALAPDSH